MAKLESVQDTIQLRNGCEIPCVGYGTWKMPGDDLGLEALHQAFADGYRHIDTAASYGNEITVGEALKASGLPREEVFVTSKVWNDDRGYDQTMLAFGTSLDKLGLEYLDMYLIHWPAARGSEDEWQKENRETWRALEQLYYDGLVRAIGVSNFKPHHLDPLMDTAEVLPMVNQIELHPGCNQAVTRDFCQRNNIVVEAWSPLGSGRLMTDEAVTDIAMNYGCSNAQLCIRWCLQHQAVPLPKSLTPEWISENARVFWFDISEEDMARLDEIGELAQSGLDPDLIDF